MKHDKTELANVKVYENRSLNFDLIRNVEMVFLISLWYVGAGIREDFPGKGITRNVFMSVDERSSRNVFYGSRV